MEKNEWLLAIISVLIFATFVPLAHIYGTTGFIPELFLFMALSIAYAWFYTVLRLNIPIFVLLVLGHVLHAAGIFGWYFVSPVPVQWDHITHFFGALPFAMLFYRFIEQWFDSHFSRKNVLLLLFVFLAATGVGALVEIGEFVGFLTLGYGDGALMFGAGDGMPNSDVIDAIGGGWINEGWDFMYNTLGIITGLVIMLALTFFTKKPKNAYYFEPIEKFSKRIL